MDQKARDLMFESGSVEIQKDHIILYGSIKVMLGGLKWDTGNGRVGIRAEEDG